MEYINANFQKLKGVKILVKNNTLNILDKLVF